MPMTRTTMSFTREGMKQIQKAAKRQGSSVSQFVREAALMAPGGSETTPTRCAPSPRNFARSAIRGMRWREGAQGRRGRGRAQALSPRGSRDRLHPGLERADPGAAHREQSAASAQGRRDEDEVGPLAPAHRRGDTGAAAVARRDPHIVCSPTPDCGLRSAGDAAADMSATAR